MCLEAAKWRSLCLYNKHTGRKHPQIKAERQHFNLTVIIFIKIQWAGVQGKHKTAELRAAQKGKNKSDGIYFHKYYRYIVSSWVTVHYRPIKSNLLSATVS